SQQPGHLPPELFELCNTRIVHALRSSHNLEALMATTGDVSRELWSRCPLLGQGQAVLSSPQLNRSVVLSVRPAACRPRFTHGGRDGRPAALDVSPGNTAEPAPPVFPVRSALVSWHVLLDQQLTPRHGDCLATEERPVLRHPHPDHAAPGGCLKRQELR